LLRRPTLVRIAVIGAINWDINLFVRRFPGAGEQTVIERVTGVPGGKAGNVAVAAARLLGPSQVSILGSLGSDSVASEQVRKFTEEGVITSGLKFNQGMESGQAYIVIDGHGENIIFSFRGANSSISPEDLDDPTRRELISAASVVAIMDPPFETSLKLAKEAKRLGKVVAWDPGSKSELGILKVKGLLENVDYVAANEFELVNLTGTKIYREAARKLIKFNPNLRAITKMGAKGCTLHHGTTRIVCKGLDLKSRGLKPVNTVGCGDAFLGAFVAALSEGRSDREALDWGNCAAGLKATRQETRGGPDRETLLKYLA
jgi:ribokinase